MTDWPVRKISDIAVGVYDGPHATPKPAGDGPVFLGIGNVTEDGHLDLSSIRHIAEEDFGKWTKRVVPSEGDIVFTYEATLNRYAIIPKGFRGCLGRRMALIRPDTTKVDTRFLFYSFFGEEWRHTIEANRLTGATVDRIPIRKFPDFPIVVPPLETQQRIAAILGAYDDLIEVNRRRVAVLEEMARGLFDEWFVRFRFPGHEDVPIVDTPDGPLPQGWEWRNLYDTAEVSFGYAFKSKAFSTEPIGSRVVRIRDVQEGRTSTWTTEEFDPKYQVRNGDILVGMDGIFHTNFWVGGDAALNQRVTRLRPKSDLSSGWLFQAVLPKIKFFEATISGTTVAHLGAKHLKTITLPVAAPAIQKQADRFFSPVGASLIDLKVANEHLAASRDLLLPRLISGQLSVEAAERQLEDAA